jgi:hypothetical protein
MTIKNTHNSANVENGDSNDIKFLYDKHLRDKSCILIHKS